MLPKKKKHNSMTQDKIGLKLNYFGGVFEFDLH